MAEYDVLNNIGKNIRKYRELRGLTREQLAEITEIDVGYLGQCERGEAILGIAKTIRIIDFLGVSPQDIILLTREANEFERDKYVTKISELLSNCTENQLALILKLITALLPFIGAINIDFKIQDSNPNS